MTKIRYWSKTLLELDTETNRIKIIKGFHQPEAGTGVKKTKKVIKETRAEVKEALY